MEPRPKPQNVSYPHSKTDLVAHHFQSRVERVLNLDLAVLSH